MATALFVLLWWAGLFGWWIILVGTNSGFELLAGACASLLGALFALALRRRGLLRYRFEARWLATALTVPWKIVRALGVIAWVLALHMAGARHVSSRYRRFDFPTGGPDADATSADRRAVAIEVESRSPNTLPVDLRVDGGAGLRHELDARRARNDLPS